MSLELDSLFMRAFLFWGLIEREKARIEKNYEEVREIPSGMGSDVAQQLHCCHWPKWSSLLIGIRYSPRLFWKNLPPAQLTHAKVLKLTSPTISHQGNLTHPWCPAAALKIQRCPLKCHVGLSPADAIHCNTLLNPFVLQCSAGFSPYYNRWRSQPENPHLFPLFSKRLSHTVSFSNGSHLGFMEPWSHLEPGG